METNLDPSSSASPTSSEDIAPVIGSDNPKIVEWEDLQQELARLCSLSSALNKAKEKKESLAQKLLEIIKVRDEYVHQSNELEDMRETHAGRKLTHGDTSMYIKITLEDVKNQREQLCMDLRMLLAAGKTLSAAHQQLQEANKLLAGKRGHGNLRSLQKMLRRRQQYMITQVSTLYPVKAANEYKERSNSHHDGVKSSIFSFLLSLMNDEQSAQESNIPFAVVAMEDPNNKVHSILLSLSRPPKNTVCKFVDC